MAKVSENLVTTKIRGMIGGQLVFRSVDGETVVSAAPTPSSKPATEQQIAHREKFRQANYYARLVKADSALLPVYQLAFAESGYRNFNAFIVTDYFRQPEIAAIYVSETESGVQMTLAVAKLVGARTVQVIIQSPDSVELESGQAVAGDNSQTWTYQVQDAGIAATGIQVVVTATDYPGNVVSRTFSL